MSPLTSKWGLYTVAQLALGKGNVVLGQTGVAMASLSLIRSGVQLALYVDPLPISPPIIRFKGKPDDVIQLQRNEFRQIEHLQSALALCCI